MTNSIEIRKFRLIQLIMQLSSENAVAKLEEEIEKINLTKEEVIPTFSKGKSNPYIQWAETPEKAVDFFGVWKDAPKKASQLRNSTWGGRI